MIINAIVTILVEATNQRIAPRSDRTRWIALFVVCLGQLMIILDTTIVNVALPAIQTDLHFSQSSLTWVIDGYLITFGSLLLLAGRLGDLFGRKRIFLAGVAAFVVASVLCGLATSGGALVVARFLQGAAAALASAVIIAIIAVEFREPAERAKAMSLYTFVIAGGASLGLLLGGVLTEAINWHWIFFINLPIGAVAFFLGRRLIAENEGLGGPRPDRLARLGPGHGRLDRRDLRPDQDPGVGLDRRPDTRSGRRRRPAARRASSPSSPASRIRSCRCACSACAA